MRERLWASVDAFVKEHHMVAPGDSILLGLSGGADSICLTRYFLARQKRWALRLHAVHVNHGLRGEEADRDEAFVRRFCAERALPLTVERRDVRAESRRMHCSEEEAGRRVRYAIFSEKAGQLGCRKIAVAHHADDNAETILFRLARGTGAEGLSGIAPVNGKIIRPFLGIRQREIREILSELSQEHVEDGTNASEAYSRNFIRHRILPAMEEVNAGAASHIAGLGAQVRELFGYLMPKMDALYEEKVSSSEEGIFLSERAWESLHPYERGELVRRMLFAAAGRRRDIAAVHVESLVTLMEKAVGKRQDYPYGVTAVRTETGILLKRAESRIFPGKAAGEKEPKQGESKQSNFGQNAGKMAPVFPDLADGRAEISLPTQGMSVRFSVFPWKGGEIPKKHCVKYFDYATIKCKICLRTRAAGDYFVMDRQGRHKALGRYFIDEKIPASRRDEQLLLADGPHILWVLGGRISEAYKVSEATREVLCVEVLSERTVEVRKERKEQHGR